MKFVKTREHKGGLDRFLNNKLKNNKLMKLAFIYLKTYFVIESTNVKQHIINHIIPSSKIKCFAKLINFQNKILGKKMFIIAIYNTIYTGYELKKLKSFRNLLEFFVEKYLII